jgi:SAM-dependent methyltransferase
MSTFFGRTYADSYDTIYRDKDYAAESKLTELLFHTYGDGSIRSVLDLGCGTGNHSIPLAQLGYEVVGVDRSSDMLAHARRKAVAVAADIRLRFEEHDIRSVDLRRQFDAVLIMFAVLGYQLGNDDVLSALKTARLHLRPEGLLLFDVWYGPAVLHQRPSQRVKMIPTPAGRVMRASSGELDVQRHLCVVRSDIWQLEGDRLVNRTEESHPMRYFFPLELNLFLECAGFTPLRLGAFPEFDQDPSEMTWNVLQVARAN